MWVPIYTEMLRIIHNKDFVLYKIVLRILHNRLLCIIGSFFCYNPQQLLSIIGNFYCEWSLTLLFECLYFGLKKPWSTMAGIFRGLGSWVVPQSLLNFLWVHHSTQLFWCRHVCGSCFLNPCCASDDLWLVYRYSNLKIQYTKSHLERVTSGRLTGHHSHNNESGGNHHTIDDITSSVYNDVSR